MRKINISLGILLTILLISCGTNEPAGPYTSIKGAWRCTENFDMTSRSYSVDIYKGKESSTDYIIFNFYNTDYNSENGFIENYVRINLNDKSFSIPQQAIGDRPIQVKSGSGVVNDNFTQMKLDYTIYDGLRDIKVHAVYSR